jgi:hypothetical protein
LILSENCNRMLQYNITLNYHKKGTLQGKGKRKLPQKNKKFVQNFTKLFIVLSNANFSSFC